MLVSNSFVSSINDQHCRNRNISAKFKHFG
jgi:hypothetical protein